MNYRPYNWLIFSAFTIFLLAACSSSSVLQPVSESRIISAESSFGQSLTAQNNGLSGISVLLAPALTPNSGSLLFHLKTSPQSNNDLAHARLPLSEITQEAYYKFDFPPQGDSQRKDYFLKVDLEGDGQVQIFTSEADSYLDGALYENQVPQEAQLIFRLDYDRKDYLLGLGRLSIKWLGIFVVGIFAFILPGWALFALLWRGWDNVNWLSKLGLSGGLGLAMYPLFLLWTHLIGLHLGYIYAWLPPVVGLLALGWKYRRYFVQIQISLRQKKKLWGEIKLPLAESLLPNIACLVILGLVIVSRMWVTRLLDVPLFGDSYQHTMITQLIIDHGGLFNSWEPYAQLTTFTYHFGFHSTAAVFHWITGVAAPSAVLWTGQLINIFAILALYPLAYKIGKNRWAGVIAMLVGGLLSSMPMTYINWGRYTQLAGQVILPTIIWVTWSLLERPVLPLQNVKWFQKLGNWRFLSFDLGSLAIMWISLGGIALTHYRILIFFILFFPAFIIFSSTRSSFVPLISKIVWISIGGALLFFPWLVHLYGGRILQILASLVTTSPATNITASSQLTFFGNLFIYLPTSIWSLSILCIFWGLWKRKKNLMIFVVWWFLIIFSANPRWLGLPGDGVITNFAVSIAFYIPAAVIIGSPVESILQFKQQSDNTFIPRYKRKITTIFLPVLILLIVCTLGLWGLPKRIKDLKIPTYALVTRPDLRAMEWIQGHIPVDATILVNSFFAYNDTLVAGSDGGWWLPLLAKRNTSLPPITYSFEDGAGTTNLTETNNLSWEIKTKGITNPEVISLLEKRGIKYIYIGQRQGVVNYKGVKILDPQVIKNDSNFESIYHQDRVWIFEIIP